MVSPHSRGEHLCCPGSSVKSASVKISTFCLLCCTAGLITRGFGAEATTPAPRFSIGNMDRSVDPAVDFYHFAAGNWLKNNPVPADKSRWSGFEELQDRNWKLIREILESSAADKSAARHAPRHEVGDFFASAMDTNRLEKLAFKPMEPDLKRIERLKSTEALFELTADFHERGISGLFNGGVSPDAKNSGFYAFH